MRIQIASDLHTEVRRVDVPAVAEVIVAAGDIGAEMHAMLLIDRWLDAGAQVLLVLGNHEYYGQETDSTLRCWHEWSSERPSLHWLNRSAVLIGGVRFLGATLWTDYNRSDPLAMSIGRREMNDYGFIAHRGRRLSPEDTVEFHQRDRRWLEGELARSLDRATVVVTHHAPHPWSLGDFCVGGRLAPAYASDLGDLISTHEPALWIHGHVHAAIDYTILGTRVVCNPLGYPGQDTGWDPARVIEL